MTFDKFHKIIKECDTVILYFNNTQTYALEVTKTVKNRHGQQVPHVFQSMYGALKVESLVGLQFGCRVQLATGAGYIFYPTPELWTLTLPHRTQILYTTDISMVIARLNIGPGSVVCEAGTGSGSLSHAILRTVGPTGHLHTADFHEQRWLAAADEFKRHGLNDRVTTYWRDVCTLGWPVTEVADAVFLDLPRPWLALPHAVNAVKLNGGRICSFSPCIEQVSRTCELMRSLGLQNVTTLEVLTRELQVLHSDMPVIDITPDDRPNLKELEMSAGESDAKRPKLSADIESSQEGSEDCNVTESEKSDLSAIALTKEVPSPIFNGEGRTKSKSILSAYPKLTQAGHTGYLTFCIVPPGLPRPVSTPVV
ncbi:tRNA (adenine(58)-N(1))-methyltransferase catalytic subunit TRMT61A [Hyalella azteca]|uniref:tRNA (adenine(58)-N(1))-methyltransferase catalytic subunit TRMT61A n=1 Tax=Hyalella azteca TaxID=294128 RepID=A0A8B7NRL6_HYAAZ|nr:tRNA (adenine(58)-N(1))-methyltransferase catalytic subunit TRMT61A [Hyalella azteca]